MIKIEKNQIIARDVSWMYFNHRILREAQRPDVPLLERISFLGIYSNNLDEFFRVRVASLSRIAQADQQKLSPAIREAKKAIKQINTLNAEYSREFEQTTQMLTQQLREQGIWLIDDAQASLEQREYIRRFFRDKLNGTTQPVWLNGPGQLTDEDDDVIFLAVKLKYAPSSSRYPQKNFAIVKLPVKKVGRFLRLPDHDGHACLMYLDDAVRLCLPWLFAGLSYNYFEAYAFKFTKDAEMDIENDLDVSLLQKVQRGVRSRRRGEPLRVIYDAAMPRDLLKKVMGKLRLDRLDTTVAGGRYHNHKDFMQFPDCGRTDLKFPRWESVLPAAFESQDSLIDKIMKRDLMIHVPYQSFDAYLRLLREAAISPRVESIKTTLYRLAKDSKVVETLVTAAKNGKKVTVVIELLARFDEASNISWSKKMREAGINVVFGVEGLKVHSKITWIKTTEGNLACIGTGNFHEGNARVYTDCLLMTAHKKIVDDVNRVFDFIHSPFRPVRFKELLVSPNNMKRQILQLIDEEIKNKRAGKEAYIHVKINHITDPDVVRHLYKASAEGVEVGAVLRGNCSMVTGIPGLTENIHLHGIIDRYLEHARILIFAHGGKEKFYIGSADWMPRNLVNRVEVMTPVYDPRLQQELRFIVDCGLNDTVQARVVDGTDNPQIWPAKSGCEPLRSQQVLHNYYRQMREEENESGNE